MAALKIGKYYITKNDTRFLLRKVAELTDENQKCKEVIDKISKIIYEIDESSKATGGYPSNYIDELLDILKEVE